VGCGGGVGDAVFSEAQRAGAEDTPPPEEEEEESGVNVNEGSY